MPVHVIEAAHRWVAAVAVLRDERGAIVAAVPVGVADTPLRRLLGLIGKRAPAGLWIAPCRGVHTWFMRRSLAVAYVSRHGLITWRGRLEPWQLGPVRRDTVAVLELDGGLWPEISRAVFVHLRPGPDEVGRA